MDGAIGVRFVQATVESSDANGVTLTATAFQTALPVYGKYGLLLCLDVFSISSLFSYSYYATKCMSFLFGVPNKRIYNSFSIGRLILGAPTTLEMVIGLVDSVFAFMAIPTMTATIILAPRVVKEARVYFRKLKKGDFN